MGVAALLDVWGRSWAGPERGSEILCVLTHGMGSTPPPPPQAVVMGHHRARRRTAKHSSGPSTEEVSDEGTHWQGVEGNAYTLLTSFFVALLCTGLLRRGMVYEL